MIAVSHSIHLRSIMLFVCLFGASLVHSQQPLDKQIDSLLNEAQKEGNKNFKAYELLARKISLAPERQAKQIFDYAIAKDSSDLTRIYLYKGYGSLLSRMGSVDESLKYKNSGLKLAQKHDQKELVLFYHSSIASAYHYKNQLDSATYHINKAEALAENGLEGYLWNVYRIRGLIQTSLGNIEKAAFYYRRIWKRIESLDNEDPKNVGFALWVVTEFFTKVDNYPDEQIKFLDLLATFYQNRDPNIPLGHTPIKALFKEEIKAKNIPKYKNLVHVSDSLNNTNSYFYNSETLIQILVKENKLEEAISYLTKLENKLEKVEKPLFLMDTYMRLADNYVMLNNYSKALEYREKEYEVKSGVVSENMRFNVADLELKYGTEKKDAQLKFLELEAEKSSLQKKLYLIIGILGLISTLLISFFFYKNKKKNTLLAKQKILLEATIDEKNTLLKETHHRVKNSFQIVSSLLYLQSENIEDKEAQLAIKEAQNRVRSMVLIHQKLYNKDQLVGINTQEYFQDLTRDIFESHQFTKLPINYSLKVSPMVLAIETITPIGLILNELITNVLKHAFSTVDEQSKMHISLEEDGKDLLLKVTDNGKGMADTFKESSFGIKLIRALAKKLKASLEYAHAIPRGTEAVLVIRRFEKI